uniref:Uncharacterized protein n=1 Tax=Romanomermis culicivorax TaxID=13658 RepID=A0A915HG43_ROMCU
MPIHDQNFQDPLGNVVQDALANVLDGRLRALDAQIAHKVATTEARLNEPSENFEEWDKKLEKQILLKGECPACLETQENKFPEPQMQFLTLKNERHFFLLEMLGTGKNIYLRDKKHGAKNNFTLDEDNNVSPATVDKWGLDIGTCDVVEIIHTGKKIRMIH